MQTLDWTISTTDNMGVHAEQLDIRFKVYSVRDQRATAQRDVHCAWEVTTFVFFSVLGSLIGVAYVKAARDTYISATVGSLIGLATTTSVKAARDAYVFAAVSSMFVFAAALWCARRDLQSARKLQSAAALWCVRRCL